jgi:hypothetical protein
VGFGSWAFTHNDANRRMTREKIFVLIITKDRFSRKDAKVQSQPGPRCHSSEKIFIDILNNHSFFRILARARVCSQLQSNLQKNSSTCKRSEFPNNSLPITQKFLEASRVFVLGTVFAPITCARSGLTEHAKVEVSGIIQKNRS